VDELVVPEDVAAWPVLLGEQLDGEADRFVLLRVELRVYLHPSALLEFRQRRLGELLILGAVQDDTRRPAAAADRRQQQRHQHDDQRHARDYDQPKPPALVRFHNVSSESG